MGPCPSLHAKQAADNLLTSGYLVSIADAARTVEETQTHLQLRIREIYRCNQQEHHHQSEQSRQPSKRYCAVPGLHGAQWWSSAGDPHAPR